MAVELGFENKLWEMADKLRGNIQPSDYKSVILGLIFLKYISDSFEEKHNELVAEGEGFEEDRDAYLEDHVFFVPPSARWEFIKKSAKLSTIGQIIDEAMITIERENKNLKGVLPKNYARPELDKTKLGELIDLFSFNLGTLTSNEDRFMAWRTIYGDDVAPQSIPKLEVLIKGMFQHDRFLDIIKYFVLFQNDGKEIIKILAGYHQYHAVNKAVRSTERATQESGDRRIGVIWHTQGSGKSLSMVFYAGKLVINEELENPTIVVITDRNDLAKEIMGDAILKQIARDLTQAIKNNISVDWAIRESVQAKMKMTIKRLLKKYGYPPDKTPKAVETVMQQTKLMCENESL